MVACELAERRAVAEREAALHREPGDRAVHRARVEVTEAEPLRELAGDGALAGPGGPIDGDDHGLFLMAFSSFRRKRLVGALRG